MRPRQRRYTLQPNNAGIAQAVPANPAPNAAPIPRPGGLAMSQTVAPLTPVTPQTPQFANQFRPAEQPLAVAEPRKQPIDMSLPGQESQIRPADMFAERVSRVRKWAFRGAALSLIVMLTVGGLFVSQAYMNANKVFQGTTGTAHAQKKLDPNKLAGESDGRVNILLLGRGGGGHDAPDLTDTMMIASIDTVNKTATLFSIPRDLWVQVPGGGPMKINAAWATGVYKYQGKVKTGTTDAKAIQAGYATADQVVEAALGVKIHYNVLVNFQAFKQAVDTVGGVTVNVPADLVDPTMAWENGKNPVLAKAGVQAFDGKKALQYVRSRHTSSDFARSDRQRAVLMALKGKMQTMDTLSNPLKLSGLMNAFGNNVSTDLTLKNATRLHKLLKGVDDTKIVSTSLVNPQNTYVKTSNVKGQSVVIPKAGMFNFIDVHSYVATQLKDPYILREKAQVLVLNGTLIPGLASKKAEQLKAYGYNVVGSGNTPHSGWTSTTLIDMTKKHKQTKKFLENRLGMTATGSLADTSIQTNGADFVIIVGSDEATTQGQTN